MNKENSKLACLSASDILLGRQIRLLIDKFEQERGRAVEKNKLIHVHDKYMANGEEVFISISSIPRHETKFSDTSVAAAEEFCNADIIVNRDLLEYDGLRGQYAE